MLPKVKITIKSIIFTAKLDDESITAIKIVENVPFKGKVEKWGDEFYFQIPISAKLDDTATDSPQVGDLAYWPSGRMFCVFYGPTPVSEDQEPKAVSPVNIIGKIEGNIEQLHQLNAGDEINIELI